MIENAGQFIADILGLNASDPNSIQMILRSIVVYVAALLMVRIGEKRFLGKSTAFDVILGIILGSVLSRGINGNTAFVPTIFGGLTLVLLHWLIAALAFRSDRLSTIVKGESRTLVEDGEVIWQNMRKSHIGKHDLLSAVRKQGQTNSLDDIDEAYLERDGSISVITGQQKLHVVEVKVEDGVQTVRIEIES